MGIKLSSQGIEEVDTARRERGWTKADSHWLAAAHTSEPTLRRFWRRIPISVETFREICAAVDVDWQQVAERPGNSASSRATSSSQFVGRKAAMEDLAQLKKQGHKLILIQGEGGIGKTTLARKFLQSQSFNRILELPIGMTPDSIASVELVLEEWLHRYFQEEPGRELSISLDRLRRQLQKPCYRVGILIDRLETALYNGRFLHNHRRYLDLLQVLSHPDVQSLTLVASRELLYEPDILLEPYRLKPLSQDAWQQFFSYRRIASKTPFLEEMHRAYGGNAEAMCILAHTIRTSFAENLEAYWQHHRENLLLNPTLNHLVDNQFNKLRYDDAHTHRLLCRLGCYRYQAISTIPESGLFALLWDVPETQHKSIVQGLRNCALVQVHNNEYCLHPAIRAKAIEQLKSNVQPFDNSQKTAGLPQAPKSKSLSEWHLTNQAAAEFYLQWCESALTTTSMATTYAFEAIEHFATIGSFERCYQILRFHILKAEKLENLRCAPDLWNNMSRIRYVSEKLHHKLSKKKSALIQIPLTIVYAEGGQNQDAIAINQQILDQMSQEQDFDRETCFIQLSAYSVISKSYRYMGNLEQAKIACEQARKIAVKSGSSYFKAIALYGFGSLYLALDKPRKALRYFVTAAAYAQFGGITQNLRQDLKQIVQLVAKPFGFQSTEIQAFITRYSSDNRENRIKKFNILWNAIRCFNKMKSYSIAKTILDLAENLIDSGDDNQQCLLALEQATYFASQEQFSRTHDLYLSALSAASHPSQAWCQASALKQYGNWLYNIAKYTDALQQYQKLNHLLFDTDFDGLKAENLYALSLTYLQLGLPKRSQIVDNLIKAREIGIKLDLKTLLESISLQLNRF